MKVSLHRTVTALTGSLDFVGIDEVHHGKRVALMAFNTAREAGWDDTRCRALLYAGMLHDCGVSRHDEHRQFTETLEWDGAERHCILGEQILSECPPLARFATVVRWHHTRWEALRNMPLTPEQRLVSNLIYLTDRADVLLAPYISGGALKDEILWQHQLIAQRLAPFAGSLFNPEFVDAFARASAREAFWLCMDPSYIVEEIEEHLQDDRPIEVDTADALAIAGLFAKITDAKSIYTLEHSTRVARIARYLGEADGMRGERLDKLEIAGLLHDIGKLRISEDIIDKPGAITLEERALLKRHSYDTGHILKKVFPGEPIADWASMHHEDLLGTGYPDHLAAAQIPPEARLISVADIFQALSQERPYRGRMSRERVMAKLEEMRDSGRLDPAMVELMRRHAERCYSLAVD